MELLLKNNNWKFADINVHLMSHAVVQRDPTSWMCFTKPLRVITGCIQSFASLQGIEINRKTGDIKFTLSELTEGYCTDKHNTCNINDIIEMLEKNIMGASFSLDPVDPNMMYHPFNTMRFEPKDLYQTQFLNTMLLTDYILKFLTIGQEVQGTYPYDMRPVQDAIAHLPKKLKKIIDDLHAAQQYKTGSIHRFWIEAEQLSEASLEESDIHKVAISDLKMVLKKHTMEWDHNSNLVDTEKDHEGWDLYVLTRVQKEEVNSGRRTINCQAMIFVEDLNKVFFMMHNKVYKQSDLSIYDIKKVQQVST